MAFLDQNPPSFDNQLEYDIWLGEQLKAAELDQDRQDDEFEKDQARQDDEFKEDQDRQDAALALNEQAVAQLRRDIAAGDYTPTLQQVLTAGDTASGGATFGAPVKIAPGFQDNEAVTYGQLSILEEEIEQLASSQERGIWNYTSSADIQPGEYTIVKEFLDPEKQKEILDEELTQCLIEAASDPVAASECQRVWSDAVDKIDGNLEVTTDQWKDAAYYKVHKTDSKNIEHELSAEGLVVDIFNIEDDGFMAGNCTEAIDEDSDEIQSRELYVEVTQSRGSAHGSAGIKLLHLEGSGSLDNYVRKSGDTITGDLIIEEDLTVHKLAYFKEEAIFHSPRRMGHTDGFQVLGKVGDYTGAVILGITIERESATDKDDYFEYFGPTETEYSLVNKKYVDQAVGGSAGLFKPTLWTFDAGMNREDCEKGTFQADEKDFFMSTKNINNDTWGPYITGGRKHPVWVTVYDTKGKLMLTYQITEINFYEKYHKKTIVELDWDWMKTTSALVDGQQYRIVIPGFLV